MRPKHVRMIGRIGDAATVNHGWWRDDLGFAMYKVGPGDTLQQLARDYLGNPARYMELWYAQAPARTNGGNPNSLRVGESLTMTDEAGAKAVALGYLAPYVEVDPDPGAQVIVGPITPSVPSLPMPVQPAPGPSPKPSPTPPAPMAADTRHRLVVGAGIVAGAGAVALAWHFYKTHKPAPSRSRARSVRA